MICPSCNRRDGKHELGCYDGHKLDRAEIERLRAALRSVDCPAGGWTGMPSGIEATVGACVNHGVCGCSLGAALKK